MTTQQQIDDPGQWRVGDVFEGEHDGHPFSGSIWETDGRLYQAGRRAAALAARTETKGGE